MNNIAPVIWRFTNVVWAFLFIALLLLGVTYYDGLDRMVMNWLEREEYSHGLILPFVGLFLIWQKHDRIVRLDLDGSWSGVAILFAASVLYVIAEISAITVIAQYAFIISLIGICLALIGFKGMKEIWVAFLILFFTIPLPGVIFQELSQSLQLISSSIGVAVIRLFDISVYLEGNVIDLGSYKLQVVEACSGLRYLFPLMALGFIAAYFYKAAMWKRIIVFLSTIPLTVLMNSFRIGVIGVMVEYWGQSMAEGFLHDFEGWIVFMACTLIMVGEMWLLSRIGPDKVPFRDVFNIEFPEPIVKNAKVLSRPMPMPYIGAIVVCLGTMVVSLGLSERILETPERTSFSAFPLKIQEWEGREDRLEKTVLSVLDLDDYIIVNYSNNDGDLINFYSAYYLDQRKGGSIHSPRACIPGGGWAIASHDSEYSVPGVLVKDGDLRVNRLLIGLHEQRQLVYYWFKLQDNNITDEFYLKWKLFEGALMKNRSDGALIRITTVVMPNEDIASADKRIQEFLREVNPLLNKYVPD